MDTCKAKFVVAFALAVGLALAWVSPGLAATPTSTIYSFGTITPDGATPKGSLTYVNGLIFGRTTTTYKAANGEPHYGAIFHFDPDHVASTYRIDHMFAGHDVCDDGDNPRHDAMTPFNNLLYGTTLEGGSHNNGTIFSIGQDGTCYQVLLSLHNSIGSESHSCFVVGNNILYGMTASGGDNGEGVIFSLNPAAPAPTPTATCTPDCGQGVMISLNPAAPTPTPTPTCTPDSGEGAVLSFNPAAPTPTPTATPTSTPAFFQTLFSFACASSTGKEPHGRLTLDPNGTTLYGMTRKGGVHDFGVVFSIDTSGGNYQSLHDFAGGDNDGATTDHGYLVQSCDHLYGMTTDGGHHDDGVIFTMKTDGHAFQLLHKFGETHHDGKNPYGSLLLVGEQLYGTTANGGDNDLGTVFVINTDGSGYHRLYSFAGQKNSDDGSKPIDNVIMVNGWLYGMATEGGANNVGTIFKVNPNPARHATPTPRPTPHH
jgi:uncharacterized repeat protein (TIGR03803 family)